MRYARRYIDATGGSVLRGWRLLALVLSALQRYSEAVVVIDAALDETAKWDQGPLLRMKAKLQISQSLHTDAIETYRYLLALVQAQRKSYGPLRVFPQVPLKTSPFDVLLSCLLLTDLNVFLCTLETATSLGFTNSISCCIVHPSLLVLSFILSSSLKQCMASMLC